jgi:hypothetical protein
MYDFDKIDLTMKEKYKLFVTKIRKESPAEYFGDSFSYLSEIKFIQKNLRKISRNQYNYTYFVTDKYHRYLIHQRNKVFFGILTSFITPIVVSVITSIVTVLVLKLLGIG